MASLEKEDVQLPVPAVSASDDVTRSSTRFKKTALIFLGLWALSTGLRRFLVTSELASSEATPSFYSHVVQNPPDLCPTQNEDGVSYSGYIGLEGDSEDTPKRSFFWHFQAQNNHHDAPVILTIGGGPGTSGMMNPMNGQSHCRITKDGVVPNEYGWSKDYNLVALDHPIGVGFSYGTHINNSRTAAEDAYDFLQKFYRLFPALLPNKLVLSGGSYGGVYIPNIATVIHEQNIAIAEGRGIRGAVHLNLEVLLVSNPITDIISFFQWELNYRCDLHHVYNSTTCTQLYGVLPSCLNALEFATEVAPSIENRVAAAEICDVIENGDMHGTLKVDIRKNCFDMGEDDNSIACTIPELDAYNKFFFADKTKKELGVPQHVNFTMLSDVVEREFEAVGDRVSRNHRLYEPLLADGIRVLHYIGIEDANCAWPATLAFLKLIRSPFQNDFISAPDLPWEGHNATVRAIGPGAGNMTYILVGGAGHFVVKDQTPLVKEIISHFIDNVPYV